MLQNIFNRLSQQSDLAGELKNGCLVRNLISVRGIPPDKECGKDRGKIAEYGNRKDGNAETEHVPANCHRPVPDPILVICIATHQRALG